DSADELARGFRLDPNQNGFLFDNYAASLSVDEALWQEYQRAAAEIAERVTRDPARLKKLLPPESNAGTAEARARAFILSFGPKVHRRPLTKGELEEYLKLFRSGRGMYAGMAEFEAGLRLLIEGLLQSPHFLYRIEGNGGQGPGGVKLDAYDVASRLSYTLWNTMPDHELFAAAASGTLTEPSTIAAQAHRMLDDPRTEPVVLRFHAQLFERERLNQVTPSRIYYPQVSEHFAEYAARENDLFVKYELLEQGKGYKDLLTSTETFVNAELAGVYGIEGSFGDEFAKVSLDPAQRRGLLTQVAFLASHATSVDPDPIHRGVFVARRLLCDRLSAPPGMVPPLPAANGRTNRETVEQHTETRGSVCATCHKYVINPLGFPFEIYDAVGHYRTEDNGHPVNASTDAEIDKKQMPVKDGVELADALAASSKVHACYARHWLEYAYGRPATPRDDALISRLGAESANGLGVKDLVVELVQAPAFSIIYQEDLQ
ncbi:MAG TPA: DUF1592 domain-containing protein, partial [Polyangiaceae bacterium]|nr:DUF1592 domain-containing protein [Polyangiaceae bacterium]